MRESGVVASPHAVAGAQRAPEGDWFIGQVNRMPSRLLRPGIDTVAACLRLVRNKVG